MRWIFGHLVELAHWPHQMSEESVIADFSDSKGVLEIALFSVQRIRESSIMTLAATVKVMAGSSSLAIFVKKNMRFGSMVNSLSVQDCTPGGRCDPRTFSHPAVMTALAAYRSTVPLRYVLNAWVWGILVIGGFVASGMLLSSRLSPIGAFGGFVVGIGWAAFVRGRRGVIVTQDHVVVRTFWSWREYQRSTISEILRGAPRPRWFSFLMPRLERLCHKVIFVSTEPGLEGCELTGVHFEQSVLDEFILLFPHQREVLVGRPDETTLTKVFQIFGFVSMVVFLFQVLFHIIKVPYYIIRLLFQFLGVFGSL